MPGVVAEKLKLWRCGTVELRPIPEVRCPNCRKLLGYDVVAARFVCPRCKTETCVSAVGS